MDGTREQRSAGNGQGGPRRRRHPLLLQINATTWLTGLEVTDFNRVTDAELDRIADFGFDHVWLMGVWTRGAAGLAIARDHGGLAGEYDRALPGWRPEDVVGSPFAVQAYRVSPGFGGEDALAHLRERLGSRGIRLILDFVPNHTARDHEWVASHPEYYITEAPDRAREAPDRFYLAETCRGRRAVAFGRDPYFPGWTDTAQLDYRQPALREAMIATLKEIAARCDGVRCDMAMLVLADVFEKTWGPYGGGVRGAGEFWPAAIDAVRAGHPDFRFMAEVYWGLEGRLLELGFDQVYDKALYDRMRSGDFAGVHAAIRVPGTYLRRGVHFVTNHDEEPAGAAFPGGRDRPATVLATTLPGVRFVHEGQLDGRRARLPVQLGRAAPGRATPETVAFLERLFRALAEPVLDDGEYRPLDVEPTADGHDGALVALLWEARDHRPSVLVVVNLAAGDREGKIRLGLVPIGGRRVRLRDLLGSPGDPMAVDGDHLIRDGLILRLPAGGARIFRLET